MAGPVVWNSLPVVVHHADSLHSFKRRLKSNARFYHLGINLGIANLRSEDNPRFILGSSFSILSTFSNLGITNLGITRLSL